VVGEDVPRGIVTLFIIAALALMAADRAVARWIRKVGRVVRVLVMATILAALYYTLVLPAGAP
jgi:hypothetical protein